MGIEQVCPFRRLLFISAFFLFLLSGWADAYVGMERCRECHEDQFEAIAQTKIGKALIFNPQDEVQKRVCEGCHGPGDEHSAAWEEGDEEKALGSIINFKKDSKTPTAEKNAACMQCHEKEEVRYFWPGSTHDINGIACVDCHIPIKPGNLVETARNVRRSLPKRVPLDVAVCFTCHELRRAELQRSSHMPMREGKVKCTDCHNPHGGPGPKLLKTASINETCYSCHAEKRGPMLWEHAPVRENCVTCHDPHGSNHKRLLKTKGPYLCQECHSSGLHSSEMYDATRIATGRFPSARLLGNYCLNCHSRIHGSNHPSGAKFQR